MVFGIHLTPGTRLYATIYKYQQCSGFINPPDEFVKSLLDLLKDAGWSNSIEDLGTALGAPKDNEEGFAKITTEMLLGTIVEKLSQSTDYKVRDMASRYEINLRVKTAFRGDCCHNFATVENQRAVALFVDGRM